MNKFDIFRGGLPTIKQNRLRFHSFICISMKDHFPEMILFRFAIRHRRIDSKINRVIALLIGMNSINNTDPFHQAVHISTVLTFHYFNHMGMAFILNTVIHNQIGFRTVMDQRFR